MTPEVVSEQVATSPGVQALVVGRLDTLRSLLAHVEADMAARLVVSDRVLRAVDAAVCGVEGEVRLAQCLPATAASRVTVLEERLLRLEAERRQEWGRCWQDLVILRTEWRRTWREYQDLAGRLSFLAPYSGRSSGALG
jgi:hypothetical protein